MQLGHDMFDAIAADIGEADLTRFVDAVLGGQEAALERELVRLAGEGQEGIPLVRAVLRRLLAMVEAGNPGIEADEIPNRSNGPSRETRGVRPPTAAPRSRSNSVQAIRSMTSAAGPA